MGLLLLFVPGTLSADEAWGLRVCFLFLSPFSVVLWFIVLDRLVAHRRSRSTSSAGPSRASDKFERTGVFDATRSRERQPRHRRLEQSRPCPCLFLRREQPHRICGKCCIGPLRVADTQFSCYRLRSRSGGLAASHSEKLGIDNKVIWRFNMRQVLLLVSVLLLGLSWAVAQDSTSSSPSSTSSGSAQRDPSASPGQTSRTGTSGQTTVEGCLSGSNGNFTLTDKNGMSYQLTGDTAKLSEHVGHEVKITGTSGTSTGAESSTGAASGAAGSQTLQVSSVKHVSKTCKSGGGGMSH